MSLHWTYRLILFISVVIGPSAWAESQKILKLRQLLEKNPSHLAVRSKLGSELFSVRDFKGCVETLKPYADVVGKTQQLMLAQCQNQLGQHEEEILTLNLVINKFKPDALIFFRRGQAQLAAKKPEEAILSFRESIKINSKFKPPYDGLLGIFTTLNNFYEQREVIKDLMRNFGEKPTFLHKMCELYARDAYLEEAVKACRRAISRDSTEPRSHAFLGASLFELQEREQAEKILTRAAQRFPKSEDAQRAAGEMYLKVQNLPAAARFLKRAVDLNPKSVKAQAALGQVSVESGDLKTAIQAFTRACEMDKSVAKDFQTAAAKIKKNNETEDLAEEFRSEANRCRLSTELK